MTAYLVHANRQTALLECPDCGVRYSVPRTDPTEPVTIADQQEAEQRHEKQCGGRISDDDCY